MSRDFRLYLDDILQACDRRTKYISGHTFDSFTLDDKTVDAVVRNLEIIGEAIKNVPAEILALQPQIKWKDVARFRNVIAHFYFGVKLDAVWRITQSEISPLRKAAALLFDSLPDAEK